MRYYQSFALPVPWYNLVEKVTRFEVPSGRTGKLAYDSDRARIIPSKRDKNATLEGNIVMGLLHDVTHEMHKRAVVRKRFWAHHYSSHGLHPANAPGLASSKARFAFDTFPNLASIRVWRPMNNNDDVKFFRALSGKLAQINFE